MKRSREEYDNENYKSLIEHTGKELYERAIEFKDWDEYTDYMIHLIMSMNYNYEPAITEWKNYNVNEKRLDYSRIARFCELTKEFPHSEYELGKCYYDGKGVEKNLAKALELLQSAINKGNPFAMNFLANSYEDGDGVQKDISKAIELYEASLKLGNNNAIFNLANLYDEQNDYVKAIHYYKLAIKENDSEAMYNIGLIYLNGNKDIKCDYFKAMKYFKMAAKCGDSDAMIRIAEIYYDHGIPKKDITKAIKYLKRAIEHNNEEAVDKLYFVYSKMQNINKQEVVEYFIGIDRADKLKELFDYEDFEIEIMKHYNKLRKTNGLLEKENKDFRDHIDASPDGEAYYEARESWNKHAFENDNK